MVQIEKLAGLVVANENSIQNKEREAQIIIANKELTFQRKENQKKCQYRNPFFKMKKKKIKQLN
jgi:hypothetical protein